MLRRGDRGCRNLSEDRSRMAGNPDIHITVMSDLAAVQIDLDHFGLTGQTLTVTEAEIEGCADHHDHIGHGKGIAPGTAHE